LIPIHSLLPERLSLFKYHGAIRLAISDLKYNFVTDLAPEFARLTSEQLKKYFPNLLKYWQKNKFVLIPIPLHKKRFNWRGFNQSELMARLIAKNLNLPYKNILTRTRNTYSQAHLSKKILRLQNIDHSFALTTKKLPKNIILFDDVYTTGSTLNSAISILPKNKNYFIFTLAS